MAIRETADPPITPPVATAGSRWIAHTMLMFQWQDGKKVIVWPDELAPGKARFPTPPWSQRP